jgi:diguanylate cyclase (GGDEF)-like protein
MESDTSTTKRTRPPGIAALVAMSGGMLAAGVLVHLTLVPSGAVADAPYLIPWWALALGFAVFEMAVVQVNVRRDAHTITLSDVPMVFGLLLASPAALITARLAGSAVALISQRKPPERLLFNLVLHYLESVAAIAFLRGLLGGAWSGGLAAWLLVLGAHTIATLIGASAVLAAIRIMDRRRRVNEIARSMISGFAISLGAAVVALLFLIAVRSNPWAMIVVAIVIVLLYGALRLFGSLSDRHSELRSVHAFTTAVNTEDCSGAVSDTTVRDLAVTFRVGIVEIAAHHTTDEGPCWFYARLDEGEFSSTPADDGDLPALIEEASGLGVLPVAGAPSGIARRLAQRGIAEGLVRGFSPNGLAGFAVVGNGEKTGRTFAFDRALFETLTTQIAASLERVALVERLRSEITIKEHERLHDALTGLPNRVGFLCELDEALRDGSGRLAVAVVDLDHFQEINDVFGPDRGDEVLVEVGRRLRAGVRHSDVVARIGGDEFGVVFREVRGVDAPVALARRIGDAFTTPFAVAEASLTVAGSTGLAVHPDHGDDADTLLRRADMAKTVAKTARSALEVFDLEQDLAAERRLMLANDLRPALEAGKIEVHYQPKLEMSTGNTVGFEALARWQHPQIGYIVPPEFVEIAQHSGLISQLTTTVLEHSLAEAVRWRETDPALSVSVNIAPGVLVDEGFADRVRSALDRFGLPPDALILEITESQTLAEDRRTRDTVLRLAAAGIMLSIDDFGTGYAALSYLQNLPAGEVKIDRSFVARMAEHPGDLAIVEGTIKLLHSVGLRVVAEGVETPEVWELLAGLGCYAAQGFLMARPMPAEEAAAWVAEPAWTLAELTH